MHTLSSKNNNIQCKRNVLYNIVSFYVISKYYTTVINKIKLKIIYIIRPYTIIYIIRYQNKPLLIRDYYSFRKQLMVK